MPSRFSYSRISLQKHGAKPDKKASFSERHGMETMLRKNLHEPADELVRPEVEIRLLLYLEADGLFESFVILDMPV